MLSRLSNKNSLKSSMKKVDNIFASYVIQDFTDDLIKYASAAISADAHSSAFSGIILNEDQQALADMVVNTINPDDIRMVEYISGTVVLSQQAETLFLPSFM